MAAVAHDLDIRNPAVAILQPQVDVKIALMRQLSKELQNRYGTQQAAADAMELAQPDISNLYNARHAYFSISYLITIASRLGKKVSIQVL